MKRSISALLAAALAAAWCAAPMCALADDASVSVQSGQTDFSAQIEAALNARTQQPPCAFVAASEDFTALSASRGAYTAQDFFLYISGFGALVRRAGGSDVDLLPSVRAITHVNDGYAYVLIAGEADSAAKESDSNGWDTPSSDVYDHAPDTGRELAMPMDWARISGDGGEPEVLMSRVTSVPIVTGGYAYALDEEGRLVRGDMSGGLEVLYTPGTGVELRLSPAPSGVICARYDEGLLTGCSLITADSIQSAPLWSAGAEFHDGYALSYGRADDGAGRAGLYIIDESGDRLIDADAGSDWLVVNGHLYYWHADPEQAYGFRDLMLYAPQGTASPEPIPAGEQLRARLIEFGGALYLTNYDSELYRIDDSANEPEYIMDLSVNYDFNSDLMPDAILYNAPGGLGALLYLDEGDGWRYIGEVAR